MSALKKLLPVIGILILAYIIWDTGVGEIAGVLLSFQAVYLPVSLFMIFVYLVLQTVKWGYLMKMNGIVLGFWYLFKVYLIGAFYGAITPGRLGSLYRIKYIMSKTGKPFGVCAPSVVLDKILDILVIFLMAIAGVLVLVNYVSQLFFYATIIVFILFLMFFFLFLRKSWSRRILKILYRFAVPGKYKKNASETFHSFYDNMPKARQLVVPSLITLATWIVLFSIVFVIATSLSIRMEYLLVITAFPIASIVGYIPITISGWGTREAVLIAIFSLFGITAQEIVALSLLSFVLNYFIPALIGAVFSFSEEFSLKSVEVMQNE